MNWPSVLVAWWSNFAWSAGMIPSSSMQSSINKLIGNNVGNTSQVGAAASGTTEEVGGGFDISQIYKRAVTYGGKYIGNHPVVRDVASDIYRRTEDIVLKRDIAQRSFEHALSKRAVVNSTSGPHYYGKPVEAGLPLPGNYSGFAGTLAQENIRASNAFMTGFLWFLILLVILVAALIGFKWMLEGLARSKAMKQDRFEFFRKHWLGYAAALALRICFLAWFMIMFLTLFQFTYSSSGGAKGVAAVVFIIFLLGIPGAAIYACLYKKKVDRGQTSGSRQVERKTLLGKIPWFASKKTETTANAEAEQPPAESKSSTPFWKRMSSSGSVTDRDDARPSIHDSDEYTMKFGWLAARFRRTRWWFFTVWLFYEFVRAIFYAGASGYPLVQVFGILVIEVLAFAFILWARPFEGRRLNLLVVYCLGFSKVTSVALSAAFDVQFNLERIPTTVIGIVIIVIQGILTIISLIAIIVGAFSSYMSVSRNREDFRPRKWAGLREKYFNHLDRVVNDVPREKPAPPPAPEEPKEPYFEMRSVRRLAKIEDEDQEFASEMRPQDPAASYLSLDERPPMPAAVNSDERSATATPNRRSRAASVYSTSQTNLPYGARPHRPSWSTREFQDAGYAPVDMERNMQEDDEAVESPVPASKKGLLKSRSRKGSLNNPRVRPQTSSDQLSIGGDVSTRDTIGHVPAPTVRPRAGTMGSMRSVRSNRSSYVGGGESSDRLGDMLDSHPSHPNSQRASRVPLTPAQELEEWGLPTPKHSAEH